MSLSEVKLQVHKLLAAWYPVHLGQSPVAALKKEASIKLLASDLGGEAYLYLAHLTGGSDFCSSYSIHCDYGHLREACPLVNGYVPSSVADLLSLAIKVVEKMDRESIAEVRIGVIL